MKTFRYHIELLNGFENPLGGGYETVLNRLGKAGWELVTMERRGPEGRALWMYFKKESEETS